MGSNRREQHVTRPGLLREPGTCDSADPHIDEIRCEETRLTAELARVVRRRVEGVWGSAQV